jgi:hypothetical protein
MAPTLIANVGGSVHPHAKLACVRVIARVTVALIIVACGDGTAGISSNSAVASITVTPTTATVAPGSATQLTANARDANGGTVPGVLIQWSSSNASVATVSNNGTVTAVATGTVSIVAQGGGKVGASTITVARPSFALAVLGAGTGSGTVSSNPAGIICTITAGSGNCTAMFTSGTVVTLTASPGSANTFAGWGGFCAGTGACQLTMNQAVSVTASFAPVTYTLIVTGGGNLSYSGKVTAPPAGGQAAIDCNFTSSGPTTGLCTGTYPSGTAVLLTAVPGSTCGLFGGVGLCPYRWGGACAASNRDPSCSVMMTQDQNAFVFFNPDVVFLRSVLNVCASRLQQWGPQRTRGAECSP